MQQSLAPYGHLDVTVDDVMLLIRNKQTFSWCMTSCPYVPKGPGAIVHSEGSLAENIEPCNIQGSSSTTPGLSLGLLCVVLYLDIFQ